MQELIGSGRVADVVLAVMALEAVVLLAFLRPRRAGLIGLLGNLAGGAALVLALRFALTGMDWQWIAGALLLSMSGHALDLATRLSSECVCGATRSQAPSPD